MSRGSKKAQEKQNFINNLYQAVNSESVIHSGNVLALLGLLTTSANSLSDVASDVTFRYFVPLNRDGSLDYNAMREDVQKVSEYRFNRLMFPAYEMWLKENKIHSDKYLANKIADTPKILSVSRSIQDAQYHSQFNDDQNKALDENELVVKLMEQKLKDLCKDFVKLESEAAFKAMTAEEKEAWKEKHESYYRALHHESYLADILFDNGSVTNEEIGIWTKRCGNNWKVYWIEDWISHKDARDEFKRWKNGELEEGEWDTIEAYFKGIENKSDEEWAEIWNKDKETYRKKYFDDVWSKDHIKNFEETTHSIWHEEPELSEGEVQDEVAAWLDMWDDDDNVMIEFWLDDFYKPLYRMVSFCGLGDPSTDDFGEAYEKEQALLKNAEIESEKERYAGLSKEQIKECKDKEFTEHCNAYGDYAYKLFTESDLSFLNTKQYLKLKKATAEAVAGNINVENTKRNKNAKKKSKAKKWVPNDQVNDAVCRLMPTLDDVHGRLEKLSRADVIEPKDYTEIIGLTGKLQKMCKMGTSDEHTEELIKELINCKVKSQEYMANHPKGFFLTHWNSNSRYNVINKLQKEIDKQLRVIMEAQYLRKLKTAEVKAKEEEEFKKASKAAGAQRKKEKNLDPEYDKKQDRIRKDLAEIKKANENAHERKTVSDKADLNQNKKEAGISRKGTF